MRRFNLAICEIVYPVAALIFLLMPGVLRAEMPETPSPAVTNKFYSPAGRWTQVSNKNCKVWNSFPREGESVTWSGGIMDEKAHGKGVLQWFVNRVPTSSYIGEMKAGLADGHGISKGPEEEFEGEWSKGSLISTNGTIKYPDGNWYKGEMKHGFKSGKGEELMKGGIRYVGQFQNDRFHGKGELILPNGDKISGEWRNSKLKDLGVYQSAAGESFKVRQTERGIEPVSLDDGL